MIKQCLMTVVWIFVCFSIYAKNYVITDFGVVADSTILNTLKIQSVIDQASANGGGVIVIPKGVFYSGALFFKPNTTLKLEEGAVLKGSDHIDDYPLIPSRMEGKSIYYYAALINAYHIDDFSITGPGKIDGNGLEYWKAFWAYRKLRKEQDLPATNLDVHRPRLVFIWGCDHVLIKNVKLHNAGFWTTHLYQCTNVLIEGCDIRSPYQPVAAPSTDGVDIDVCKDVVVRNCYISVNDDGIAIKGGKGPTAHKLYENGIVENVLIEDCTFGFVHATLTMGSECLHAKNITIRNCKIDHDRTLLNMKMRPDTYQIYENIRVENITGRCRYLVTMRPWKQFFNMEGTSEKPFGMVQNIVIENCKLQCEHVGIIRGNANDSIHSFVLKDLDIQAKNEVLDTDYSEVQLENVKVNGVLFSKE
ncbi:glycoside hydrolase family 28 protein [Plebeiibacterium sediminum]|uniref:Glycosyl hydrolase family 28 protein n=1 Tax=Plebeiibacterium sediminum TaxID=2992112 RepID=A0AAE3M5J4_9BACT|nr:glycosyl hydrolase family 28 protein [Plebeiobacterium sediminum]MCW3787567.1 glycosyl hydrolase family 28 protein [Plebeiobacterium sediminum]